MDEWSIISSTSGRLARSRTRSRAQTSSDPVARQRFKDETGLEIPESQPKVNLDEFVDLEHWGGYPVQCVGILWEIQKSNVGCLPGIPSYGLLVEFVCVCWMLDTGYPWSCLSMGFVLGFIPLLYCFLSLFIVNMTTQLGRFFLSDLSAFAPQRERHVKFPLLTFRGDCPSEWIPPSTWHSIQQRRRQKLIFRHAASKNIPKGHCL